MRREKKKVELNELECEIAEEIWHKVFDMVDEGYGDHNDFCAGVWHQDVLFVASGSYWAVCGRDEAPYGTWLEHIDVTITIGIDDYVTDDEPNIEDFDIDSQKIEDYFKWDYK